MLFFRAMVPKLFLIGKKRNNERKTAPVKRGRGLIYSLGAKLRRLKGWLKTQPIKIGLPNFGEINASNFGLVNEPNFRPSEIGHHNFAESSRPRSPIAPAQLSYTGINCSQLQSREKATNREGTERKSQSFGNLKHERGTKNNRSELSGKSRKHQHLSQFVKPLRESGQALFFHIRARV